MYRTTPYLVAAVLVGAIACGFTQEPVEPSALANEAAIVPLIMGSKTSASFVVTGRIFKDEGKGLAFQLATDGKKQRITLYDAADGTPILLSDGKQTLNYDLVKGQISKRQSNHGRFWLDYNRTEPDKMSFNFSASNQTPDSAAASSGIALEQLVSRAADKLQKTSGENGTSIFTSVGENQVLTIQKSPKDSSWYRLTLTNKKDASEEGPSIELEARYIGKPVPAEFLRFPDAEKLGKEITLAESPELKISEQPSQEEIFAAMRGQAKMFLAMGMDKIEEFDENSPKLPWNWDELRKMDAEFGLKYRAALKKQGVGFPPFAATPKAP